MKFASNGSTAEERGGERQATSKMQQGWRGERNPDGKRKRGMRREGEVCLQFLLVAVAAEKGSQVRRKKEGGAEKKSRKNRERDVGGSWEGYKGKTGRGEGGGEADLNLDTASFSREERGRC